MSSLSQAIPLENLPSLSQRLSGACCSHCEITRSAKIQELKTYLYTQVLRHSYITLTRTHQPQQPKINHTTPNTNAWRPATEIKRETIARRWSNTEPRPFCPREASKSWSVLRLAHHPERDDGQPMPPPCRESQCAGNPRELATRCGEPAPSLRARRDIATMPSSVADLALHGCPAAAARFHASHGRDLLRGLTAALPPVQWRPEKRHCGLWRADSWRCAGAVLACC